MRTVSARMKRWARIWKAGLVGFLALAAVQRAGAYTTLDEAYAAMGFDPWHTNNAVIAYFSDPHMNLYFEVLPVVTNLDQRLVNVINGMNPPPAKIFVAGDVSTTLSPIPGSVPRGWSMDRGTNEMIYWQLAIKSFTNLHETNIVWMPGNHDQLWFETNAETFRLMFPQMPTRQTVDVAGMRFFFVNCGNYGGVDEAQSEWLREEVAKTSPNQPLAVINHVPPFLIPATYRALALDLRELFGDWPAPWWTLSGHYHARGQTVYRVGRSNVCEFIVGVSNPKNTNGRSYDSGAAVLCISNGIAGIVYYHYNDGSFEVAPPPNWNNPKPFYAAFEDTPGLLWRRLKTRTPASEVIYFRGDDAIDWYTYTQELYWKLPLHLHSNQATHFAILGVGLLASGQLAFSGDSNSWEQAAINMHTNWVHTFPIPAHLASLSNLYVRYTGTIGDNIISGWGLATTNSPPWVQYPQLLAQSNHLAQVGKPLTVTNRAVTPYSPPDPLVYSLLNGPAGAVMDRESGVLSWVPPKSSAGKAHVISMRVTDAGTPVMSATNEFRILVAEFEKPEITGLHWQSNSIAFLVSAQAGEHLTVWTSTNLTYWTELLTTNLTTDIVEVFDTISIQFPQRYYRASVMP